MEYSGVTLRWGIVLSRLGVVGIVRRIHKTVYTQKKSPSFGSVTRDIIERTKNEKTQTEKPLRSNLHFPIMKKFNDTSS
jgi:hypothetical protein